MFNRVTLAFRRFAESVRRLPQAVAKSVAARQRQTVLAANEAERLDRIRNPSKYVGK
jgi:hypothetical protein